MSIYDTELTIKKIQDNNPLQAIYNIQTNEGVFNITFSILEYSNLGILVTKLFKYQDRVYRILNDIYTFVDTGEFGITFNTSLNTFLLQTIE